MNILDWICLAIIGAAVVVCSIKGLRKIFFKISAFVLSILIAEFIGSRIGYFLLSDLIHINLPTLDSDVTEKISNTIISTLGTLIVFLLLFFILKKIFAIVEGRLERKLHSVIVDRILGALTGLFFGVAFVFVFTEVVVIIFTAISAIKRDIEVFKYVDNSIIFKFFRNLN